MSLPINSLYSLTWGDYGTSLVSAVQLLRCHGDLVDCTLAAGGRSFPAHKIVLCAASPFLLDLLKVSEPFGKRTNRNTAMNRKVHIEPRSMRMNVEWRARRGGPNEHTGTGHRALSPCIFVSLGHSVCVVRRALLMWMCARNTQMVDSAPRQPANLRRRRRRRSMHSNIYTHSMRV